MREMQFGEIPDVVPVVVAGCNAQRKFERQFSAKSSDSRNGSTEDATEPDGQKVRFSANPGICSRREILSTEPKGSGRGPWRGERS
jgi:hypothetical protein